MWSLRRTRVFLFRYLRLYNITCPRCSIPCPETGTNKAHFYSTWSLSPTDRRIRELPRISSIDFSWSLTSVNSWLPNWVLTFRESYDFLNTRSSYSQSCLCIQTAVQISHSDSVLHECWKTVPSESDTQDAGPSGPSFQHRRHCITAGLASEALQDRGGRTCLLSQEMGEARLEIITQTFLCCEGNVFW